MVDDQYACWREELRAGAGAATASASWNCDELDAADRAWLDEYYRAQVRPVLTPLAIDPAHPFPQLLNKSLNLIVRLEMRAGRRDARSTWPWCRSRASCRGWSGCRATTAAQDYVYLGQLIGHYLADLFPGHEILGYWPFRVTRNSELYIDEEEAANLLKAVENELHNRRKGDAVRLEVDARLPGGHPRRAAQDAAPRRRTTST